MNGKSYVGETTTNDYTDYSGYFEEIVNVLFADRWINLTEKAQGIIVQIWKFTSFFYNWIYFFSDCMNLDTVMLEP